MKTRTQKHIAEQFEIRWDTAEPFALEVQSAVDGARVQAERVKVERERREAAEAQEWLLPRG